MTLLKHPLFRWGVKIVFISTAFYILYHQIDWGRLRELKFNWGWIGIAFLLFNLSQITSALRLHPYLRTIGVRIGFWEQLKLYYLGMFYNTLLPGGVGGDGYKWYIFAKRGAKSGKVAGAVLILDRLNGLVGLGIIVALLAGWVIGSWGAVIAVIGVVIGGCIISVLHKRLGLWPLFLWGVGWGLVVQLLQGAVFCGILTALGDRGQLIDYLFLFYLSSILSVIPITIGGVGLRELTFLYGSRYFHLSPELGVAAAFLFFTLSLLSSLLGGVAATGVGDIGQHRHIDQS